MIKRLDTLEVATADLADASSIYEKNFGFAVTRSADGKSASVKVGGAEIRLIAGALDSSSEGMIGLWLEADDVEQVVANFHMAGLDAGNIRNRVGTPHPDDRSQIRQSGPAVYLRSQSLTETRRIAGTGFAAFSRNERPFNPWRIFPCRR